jgi:hypothetical protein
MDPTTDPPPDPDPTPASCDTGATYTFVLDMMDLGHPVAGGDPTIVPGFDLDGRVSDGTDAASCRQVDYVSPHGDPGIDNQLGPAMVEVPDVDVTGDLERAVQRGRLILLARISHVDDLVNDDCVDFDVLFGRMPEGMTAPATGVDDRFMPGQTFDVSERTLLPDGEPRFHMGGATIVNGRVDGTSADAVPFQIPTPGGDMTELSLLRPRIAADVSESGIENGVLGGRLDVEDTIGALSPVAPPVLVDALLRGLADLEPDERGICQSVSAAAVFAGVPAVEGVTR